MTITVTIPLPHRDCSPNGYKHWRKVSAAKKDQRQDACIAALAAKPKDWTLGKCRVSATFYGARKGQQVYVPRDVLNAWASLKAALDGLTDAGMWPDDSKQWVELGACEILSDAKAHKGRSEVELRIERMDAR